MALSFQWSATGATLIIPGSYASIQISPSANSTISNGVLILVGEAQIGPDFSLRKQSSW